MDDAARQANRNQAMKEALKIPYFYGEQSMDTLSIDKMIDRFEAAVAAMGQIDEPAKCGLFGNYLRGSAALAWKMLDHSAEADKNIWAQVKAHFMFQFNGAQSQDIIIKNLTDLHQKQDETVVNFFNRCFEHVVRLQEATTMPADAEYPAQFVALTAAQKAATIKKPIEALRNKIVQAFFMTYLREPLASDLQKKNPATYLEAKNEAIKLEIIYNKDKVKKSAAASKVAVLADYDDDELEDMDLDEGTILAINMQRGRFNKPPFRRRQPQKGARQIGFGGGNGNGNGNGHSGGAGANGGSRFRDVVCRYCKRKGHFQRACSERLKVNGPMLDEHGKPYPPRPFGTHQVEEEDDQQVSSMRESLEGRLGGLALNF